MKYELEIPESVVEEIGTNKGLVDLPSEKQEELVTMAIENVIYENLKNFCDEHKYYTSLEWLSSLVDQEKTMCLLVDIFSSLKGDKE